ncbi:MAG TPA: glycosyltransferase family 4 protein [Vicinamibacterales bacterium]|nr:glycosyltransferase family 4 protein [Vicinamibacterales bacterium]
MMSPSRAHARLRVAHLIESSGPGGAERVLADLATSFQAANTDNVVFLPRDGEDWLRQQFAGSGVAIEYFKIDRPVSPQSARALTDAFRKHRIDVAHSHEFSMAVYGGWAAWRAGIPHVITMHGGRYYASRLRRRLALRAAVTLSAATVAVSSPLAQAISDDLGVKRSRILMVPNGVRYVNPERVTLRDELGLHADDRLIVAVGNLYPVKGHQYLVDALALIASKYPRLHVAIAGRGGLEEMLRSRAADLHLRDRVHLLGLRSDIPAILAAADVFALPSLSEGLPIALIEAMFAARPIVATEVGEVGVALDGGQAGLLVEPGNVNALAAAVDGLLAEPARAETLGERAAGRARTHYSLSRMVARYANLYEQALGATDEALSRLSAAPDALDVRRA